MRLKFRQDLKQEFGQFFSAKFVFKLVIWTQPSGPLCLWQCFSSGFSRENIEAHCTVCTMLKSKLKPLFLPTLPLSYLMIAVTRVMMKVDIPSSVVAPHLSPLCQFCQFSPSLCQLSETHHTNWRFSSNMKYLIYVCTHDIAVMTMIYDNLRFLTNLCIHEFHDFKAVREGVKNLSHGIDH